MKQEYYNWGISFTALTLVPIGVYYLSDRSLESAQLYDSIRTLKQLKDLCILFGGINCTIALGFGIAGKFTKDLEDKMDE